MIPGFLVLSSKSLQGKFFDEFFCVAVFARIGFLLGFFVVFVVGLVFFWQKNC